MITKHLSEQIDKEAKEYARQHVNNTIPFMNLKESDLKRFAAIDYANGATEYASKLQLAEDLIEKMATDLRLINKWCQESGLKAVAIDNSIHMAVYQSLHQSNKALTDYNTYKSQSNDPVNG